MVMIIVIISLRCYYRKNENGKNGFYVINCLIDKDFRC